MDTFFIYLKKCLVATVFTMFALVATYIPQDWNKVETAYAGAATGGSTEPTQILNNIELLGINISTTLSAAYDAITSWVSSNLWVKEYILDGITWATAKTLVTSMVQSLITWINSGFKGSPMFVQDLEKFLLEAVDRAIGEYLDELGGITSFLCDPFKLDIQIAIALQYEMLRVDQPAPTCTLTGIIDNTEGFLSGAEGSFSEGGWEDWFDITSQPDVYTPFGSGLAAQAGANVRILNTKGEEVSILEWGDGFLSGEICNMVEGPNGTSEEECFISKPGKIIEEALSVNLDSGRQALITADEIDEIIAALLGQLANTALTGAAGLLGLSTGTGYTYTGFDSGSYLGDMTADSLDIAVADALDILNTAKGTQSDYQDLATFYLPLLEDYAADLTNDQASRDAAAAAALDAAVIISNTTDYIAAIDALIVRLNLATTITEVDTILSELNNLPLYTQDQIDASEREWQDILNN